MKRKDVRKLMRQHPSFAAWVRQDPKRVRGIRTNPAEAGRYYRQWQTQQNRVVDLDFLRETTRRASELLDHVKTALDMMTDLQKKRDREQS